MKYVKYTYVDAITQVSVHDTESMNGPVVPDIKGLLHGFALESLYPTAQPVFYGTTDDDADLTIAGVLSEVTEEEYTQAQTDELAARTKLAAQGMRLLIKGVRQQRETAGFIWNGIFIDTSEASYAKVLGGRAAAKDGIRKDGDIWKAGDPETGQEIYRETTNEEMIDIGDKAFSYVQGCFNREAELVTALAAGTFTMEALDQDWPSRT